MQLRSRPILAVQVNAGLCSDSHSHHALCGASFLPMLPKHTQLTNSTLAIQVAIPMVSWLMSPRTMSSCGAWKPAVWLESPRRSEEADRGDGEGSRVGLTPRSIPVPPIENRAERMKPGGERSMRNQMAGFARARVNDSCRVDCQGSLRMAKAIPTKAPTDHTTSFQATIPCCREGPVLRVLRLASSSCSSISSSTSPFHTASRCGRP
jgi:hypothetical protein